MKKSSSKLLILLFIITMLLTTACGNTADVTAEAETKQITATPENEEEPVAEILEQTEPENNEIAYITISNNSPYDEGESNTPDFSNLLASENGIEIYGENNLTFETPADGMWNVVLLVKNNNDYAVEIDHGSAFDVTIDNFTGTITDYCRDFTVGLHPNGSDYIIEPNSELQTVFDISLPNFSNQAESVEGDLVFHYEFRIFDSTNNDKNVVADINLAVNSYIKYLGRDYRSDENNRNATIKGQIIDINSNPVSGADVEIKNGLDEGNVSVQTDANGEFEIKVSAYKSKVNKMWHECVLKISHPDYDEKYICVYPKTCETNEASITLVHSSQSLSYENTAVVDLGIQAYSYDTDVNNKSVIAFTPFHSGLNYSDIKDMVNINVTDFDGNVKFKYQLNAEAPWICVSDDGKYVVTEQAIDEGNESSTYIVVLDEGGNTVYTKDIGIEVDMPQGTETETIHSRCAELSHDNKYLVIGSDDGDFWVVDWQNDSILWTYKTHGQVRNFVFNEENNILLVSSGDAFMYGFDIDGNLLFKTYVGSWATDMELVDNKLAYTLKTAFDSVGVIDITSGEKIWTYAARARGSGLAISKDKKYLWWGNDVSSSYSCINNVVFDLETGEIAYVLDTYAGQEAMYSDDGNYLVVKTSTELEVFETTNYSRVTYIPVIEQNGGDNTASINQTVIVNKDASKIVAAFNNDPSCRFYGQAYYFVLCEKNVIGHNENADIQNNEEGTNNDAIDAAPYRLEGNDIIFEKDTKFQGLDVYDNVIVNENVEVSLPSSDSNGINGFSINISLTVQNGADIISTGNGAVSPRLEFSEGARATGIDLYSEGGDLLNVDGEFINDSGSTLAFIWNDGKWTIEQ